MFMCEEHARYDIMIGLQQAKETSARGGVVPGAFLDTRGHMSTQENLEWYG